MGAPPQQDRIKVLYIAGWGRSGSTIMGNILGQVEGCFNVGELRYIWDRSLLEDRLCGCGLPFSRCPTWAGILERARLDGTGDLDPQQLIALRDRSVRTRHLPLLWLPGGEGLARARWRRYLQALESLYRAVQQQSSCQVIVDSSKFPTYGYALDLLPLIDLHVVHLVRDPRAVSFSWMRKKRSDDQPGDLRYMVQHGPLQSTMLWLSWNLATERFWGKIHQRYLLLRYEDFIQQPRDAIQRILELLKIPDASLPFVSAREVQLGPCHTVSGNPDRTRQGVITLRPDDEWRRSMRLPHWLAVTALAWPLLKRYGYSLHS